jgi:hypothetical protein
MLSAGRPLTLEKKRTFPQFKFPQLVVGAPWVLYTGVTHWNIENCGKNRLSYPLTAQNASLGLNPNRQAIIFALRLPRPALMENHLIEC